MQKQCISNSSEDCSLKLQRYKNNIKRGACIIQIVCIRCRMYMYMYTYIEEHACNNRCTTNETWNFRRFRRAETGACDYEIVTNDYTSRACNKQQEGDQRLVSGVEIRNGCRFMQFTNTRLSLLPGNHQSIH